MRQKVIGLVTALSLPGPAFAVMVDDPVLTKVMIDQLEYRSTEGPDPWVLDAEAWVGKDLHKLWLKTDVEWVDDTTEEAELQALYSRAVAPYWDLQIGWRHDARPEPTRDWLAVGFKGLSPYWFEIDAALFFSENARASARLEAEYEWLFTQRWILAPELEANVHTKDDEDVGVGSGLSDIELGLRLRYEIRREFAPYLGVNWKRLFGGTADLARDEGEDTEDIQFVLGVRAWF